MLSGLLAALLSIGASASGGELHLYTSLDPLEVGAYVQAFEAASGVRVRWVRLSSGELLTRVRAERARPQASVWFGGSSAEFTFAAAEGLLEPYRPSTFTDFAPGRRDPEWRWVGISESLVGFASSPSVLKEQGASIPRAWKDLLAPELHDVVSMAYAYTSGTAYTIAASLVQLFGESGAAAYWRALDRNVHHYNRSGSACVTQVGLKEVGICIAFTNDILTKGVSRGYDIVMTFPAEGAAYEVDAMGMIRGAPEPELARRFIDFIVDVPAQRLLAENHRVPVRPEAGPGKDIPADVKRMPFDPAAAARTRGQTIELWREATGQ
jgi:iron(III) transport system substrate-binding protein